MKNKIKITIFLLLLFLPLYAIGYRLYAMQPQVKHGVKAKKAAKQNDIYYCPMHPTYISDRPGDCPICNMKLVKKPASPAGGEEAGKIEKEAKTAKDICILHNCPMLKTQEACLMQTTGDVKDCPYCGAHLRKSEKILYYRNPMNPKVTSPVPIKDEMGMDYTPVYEEELKEEGAGIYISPEKQQLIGVKTDKVVYRPLRKLIRTVGRVAFDPELYKAQTEYIEAIKTKDSLKESMQEVVTNRAEALVEAAKLKLRLQGLDIKQIEELEESRKNDQSLLISSSESDSAWVYATIYEYELEWIKTGQEALITATAYPAKEFKGKIVAIDPVFNAMTRSVRARISVENENGLLKPDMYVDVQMYSDLGAYLAVPREAIMDSGLRKIVFLSLDTGRFRPVEVRTGVSTEEYVQVLEGLKDGDTVVVSGNFLIDSESKLKSALQGISHEHGQ